MADTETAAPPAMRVRVHQETGAEARTYTLEFTDGERSWREPLWSVTTLLKALDKPGLPRWAAASVADYVIEQLDDLPRDLERFGPAEFRKMLANSPYRTKSRAADIGTGVHQLVDAHIRKGVAPPVDATIEHEVRSRFDRFLEWEAEFRPQYLGAEMTVFNPTDGWAGTLDLLALVGDHERGVGLIDLKNTNPRSRGGGPGIYIEHALQVAAYAHATSIIPARGQWLEPVPMPDVKWGAVLWLHPSRAALVEVSIAEPTYRAFLVAAEMFRFNDGPGKRVVLGERSPSHFGALPDPIVWESTPAPVEDGTPPLAAVPDPPPAPPAPDPPPAEPDLPPAAATINDAQRRRMLKIGSNHGMRHPQVKALVLEMTGATSTTLVPLAEYDRVIAAIEATADPGPQTEATDAE